VRSFQDARLFPTMTTLDVVVLAQERAQPTRFLASTVGLPTATRRERRKADQARQVLAAMGLDAYASATISSLSTGTRRMVELACMISLQPRLLLLDEPSAGIAQRESEALAGVILRLRDEMAMTVVVIEHDIPLIMRVSDRVLAMDAGRQLVIGSPADVCAHPDVIASYLGADQVAISRSGRAGVLSQT
jgi:ABC-type branched-subunit amino acid transport system ATPase component